MKLHATVALALIVLTAAPAAAIVGGNPTSANNYPYFVKIHVFRAGDSTLATQCGASVIDAGWILTAAHCLDVGAEQISVKVFIHDSQDVNADLLIMHPLWNGDAEDGHDLALLRVPLYATEGTGGITAAMKVQVGAPADPGAYAPGVIATVVGHGFTQAGGSLTTLHDLHTPLRSDADMDAIYDPWYWVSNWNSALMIGAGWTNHTVCEGDSGGPLTVDVNGVTVQVGVVSFVAASIGGGVTCDQPGVYAELSGPQLAWIAATIPGVAARWGTCWINTGRLGLQTPGRWVATYVDMGSDASAPDKDGTYRWKISCVTLNPPTRMSGPRPGVPPEFTD